NAADSNASCGPRLAQQHGFVRLHKGPTPHSCALRLFSREPCLPQRRLLFSLRRRFKLCRGQAFNAPLKDFRQPYAANVLQLQQPRSFLRCVWGQSIVSLIPISLRLLPRIAPVTDQMQSIGTIAPEPLRNVDLPPITHRPPALSVSGIKKSMGGAVI